MTVMRTPPALHRRDLTASPVFGLHVLAVQGNKRQVGGRDRAY